MTTFSAMTKTIFPMATVVACFFITGELIAQVSAQMRPSISPYMQLNSHTRGGTGSNYLDFVKPQLDMMRAYDFQQQQIQRQGVAQQAMQQTLQQELQLGGSQATSGDGSAQRVLDAPRQVKSMGGMRGAGYRQYMHYYQSGLPQGGVPQFSKGRRY